MGANPLTFAGLAGLGDVIATCGSKLSRNHRLGEELANGRTWAEIEQVLPGVAEGAYTVNAALALAARHGVEMPIAQEVHNALFEGKSVQRCLIDLLARESKDELADFQRWVALLGGPDGADAYVPSPSMRSAATASTLSRLWMAGDSRQESIRFDRDEAQRRERDHGRRARHVPQQGDLADVVPTASRSAIGLSILDDIARGLPRARRTDPRARPG